MDKLDEIITRLEERIKFCGCHIEKSEYCLPCQSYQEAIYHIGKADSQIAGCEIGKFLDLAKHKKKSEEEIYNSVMNQREVILAAFIAEMGLKPSECVQIHEKTSDGSLWYITNKAKVSKSKKIICENCGHKNCVKL